MVHRDIKPANLIRQPDGRLVLVDFGSVRDTLRDAVSGGGSVAGTVGFMAPEQLAGQVEPASDLYAIAMTAVTLLAREEPVALHDRAGRPCWEHMVSVSEGTIKLLRAMLEADPARRPQSAAVVRGYIEQLIVADEDARNNADIGPTLVPTPSPLFDGPTGVHGVCLMSPPAFTSKPFWRSQALINPLRIEPHEPPAHRPTRRSCRCRTMASSPDHAGCDCAGRHVGGGIGLRPVTGRESLWACRFVHKSPKRGRTGHIAYKTIDM